MHFFSSKKLATFLVVALKTQAANAADCFTHCQNKTNKVVTYGNIFIFCSLYCRSKAIGRAEPLSSSQGGGFWRTLVLRQHCTLACQE